MKKLLVLGLVVLLLAAGAAVGFTAEMDIVETAMAADDFNTLVAAVSSAGLVEALQSEGPFTVFAPTDEAFGALPDGTVEALLDDPETLAQILQYHVVPGAVLAADVVGLDGQAVETLLGKTVSVSLVYGNVYINEAQVTATDIQTANGVIHVIDTVLIPQDDIVETAIAADDFDTLVAAVVAAGLVEALQAPGPLTVFAPTDEAFASLPEGTLEGLLEDTDALQSVLLYHVVAGSVMAADAIALDGEAVETLLGETLTISVRDGAVFLNDSQVVAADISTANGVIHVIDAVLVP